MRSSQRQPTSSSQGISVRTSQQPSPSITNHPKASSQSPANVHLPLPRCELEELNLNCGCPSDKVGGKSLQESKQFGARLMHKPAVVQQCVHAMARAAGDEPDRSRR